MKELLKRIKQMLVAYLKPRSCYIKGHSWVRSYLLSYNKDSVKYRVYCNRCYATDIQYDTTTKTINTTRKN